MNKIGTIAQFIIAFLFNVYCFSQHQPSLQKGFYFNEEGLSKEVLGNYLDRSVTMAVLLVPEKPEGRRIYPYNEDYIRLIKNIGAKFIGRAIYRWGNESRLNDTDFLERC